VIDFISTAVTPLVGGDQPRRDFKISLICFWINRISGFNTVKLNDLRQIFFAFKPYPDGDIK